MFGRSDRTAFKPVPYRGKPKPLRVPSWLLWLLLGLVGGASGFWYVQTNHLPPRLSPSESQQLRDELATANAERQKQGAALASATDKMNQAQAREKKALTDATAAAKNSDKLQKDLAQMMLALPPDPRGGAVAIRTGNFSTAGNQLSYNVILTRAGKKAEPFKGVMQLVVAGTRGGSATTNITLNPVPLELDSHVQLAATVNLPAGLEPREITVRVLRSAGGELVSMRVYRVS